MAFRQLNASDTFFTILTLKKMIILNVFYGSNRKTEFNK